MLQLQINVFCKFEQICNLNRRIYMEGEWGTDGKKSGQVNGNFGKKRV